MDALVVRLQAVQSFSHRSRFSTEFVTLPLSRRASLGVRGFRHLGLTSSSLNGSASSFGSSSQEEDEPDEPPGSKKDGEGEYENVGSEWLVNGERSSSSTPSCTPSKEELLRLRRNAELRKIYDDLAKHRSRQLSEDLQVHEGEVRVPSWAATALTFAIAFSAGVVLAQFRGDLKSRNKRAVVDVRVAPSGIASVPYPEQLLGHFRAQEAPQSDLKDVLADGSVKLRTAAADSFLRMQDAAREEGVWLIPLSGFRSVSSQQGVFFDVKAERKQSVTERAKISAPPGYSEHHTGYAIDIGDPTDPKTYFRSEFDVGPTYRWLQQNAARFHFELSFPKDNLQGVLYEPWHWRFVGDDHSLLTFYAQHKFVTSFPNCKY
ncbi:hypothetical protein M758_7G092400 [Ceratodon purpureus]|nr:hypothetical protein M758_7G092400 [Ceratodon purpureus]